MSKLLKLITNGKIVFLVFPVLFLLLACKSAAELEFERGVEHQKSGNFSRALVHFRRTIARSKDKELIVQAAERAAGLADAKTGDLELAIKLHRTIISNSADDEKRFLSQSKISDIVFSKMNNYARSIVELNRTLSLSGEKEKKNHYRLLLARAYFYQKRLYQAEVEAKMVMQNTKNSELRFSSQFLIGNIYQASERADSAIQVFEELVQKFPKLSIKENVAFNLALSFEERKEYAKAIEILKKIRNQYPTPEYIDLKVRRLTQRIKNLPGAAGLRK